MSDSDDDDKPLYVPLAKRRQRAAARGHMGLQAHKRAKLAAAKEPEVSTTSSSLVIANSATPITPIAAPVPIHMDRTRSLVDIALELKKQRGGKEETEEEKRIKEEKFLLDHLTADRAPLVGIKANATGKVYTERMDSGFIPPYNIRHMSKDEQDKCRKQWNITVQGDDIPPPIKKFKDMRLPDAIISSLKAQRISRPNPIQMQGIPVALKGRDMIGIAFTGSGKTICFCVPMIMFALRAETKLPLIRGEGPVALTISPSRELAKQTREVLHSLTVKFSEFKLPDIRCLLVTGGIDMKLQNDILRKGPHVVAATPGKLLDMLKRKQLSLRICQYLCLDEADRLIDLGFEEDIRSIFDYFTHQRQTVLFSATMPKKIQEFALSALIDPIVVNVGRAGAANLDVIQEVEYVKPDGRMTYILECLQKTEPPVLIFASNQYDVDAIHEYLLLKGVDAAAIHGGKAQSDRSDAIESFKNGRNIVLVATDVASKGLDFPDIQHVINYDMPKEIEDYIHRIGRTGRCGKTGVATTFINREVPEITLLDLKYLLMEAKQRVPPMLMNMDNNRSQIGVAGIGDGETCPMCDGFGHRLQECPKLKEINKSKAKSLYGYDNITSNEM